jgi:transposase
MKDVELYARVRRAVFVEGISQREAARRFGIDSRTVAKMLAFSVPPGYRRSKPPVRPKLDPFVGIIDRILEEDKSRPTKQRHTSKRIFERLRDEHGYAGGITIVKDYVHERRRRQQEVFVPLRHDPGHAQVDFGEAIAVIGGVERQIHLFAMDLPRWRLRAGLSGGDDGSVLRWPQCGPPTAWMRAAATKLSSPIDFRLGLGGKGI